MHMLKLIALPAMFLIIALVLPTPFSEVVTQPVLAQTANWVQLSSGTTNELRSVHFNGEMEGWAAGAQATLLRTNSGGTTWSAITNTGVDPVNGFNTVRLTNPNTVWVGGRATVARSLDVGANWAAAPMPNTSLSATNVTYNTYFPLSATEFWAAGNGQGGGSSVGPAAFFIFSASGSLTKDFSTNFGGSNPDQQILDLHFLAINNGWLVGPGGIKRFVPVGSTGINLRFQSSPTSERLNAIYMLDNNQGWIAGDKGTILKTLNGGDLWTAQPSGTTANLRDVHFVNANRGWTVGDGGAILTTGDGGATWALETSSVTANLRSVLSMKPRASRWAITARS